MQPHIWNNKEPSANPFFQANSIHCCPGKSREFVLCQFCTMMLPNQHHAQPLSHAVLFNTKPITSNHQAKFKHTTERIQITLQVVKKQTPISSWPSHGTSPGDLSHGPWVNKNKQTSLQHIATTALKRSKHNLHFHNMHSHNCLPTCHCRLHVFLEGTSERNYPQLAASLQEMAEGHNVEQNGQSAPHSPSGCLSQALYKHQT